MPTAIRLAACLAGLQALCLDSAQGQQIFRDGFETREPIWVKGSADAAFREIIHKMTDETAHGGQRSESIQLKAEQGTFIYYYYETGRAPMSDDFNAGLWVKANRPGIELLARVVFPNETDPKQPDRPLTVLLRGDLYKQAGRWQRLEIRQPLKLTKDQQQLLRTELNKDIKITDAYVDRLILNLFAGPGDVKAWIDDLEIGPLAEAGPFKPASRPSSRETNAGRNSNNRAAVVKMHEKQLLVSDKQFFFRAIRYTDTPLKALRDAGFNTLWIEDVAASEVVEEAVNQGFWIVPGLAINGGEGQVMPPDGLAKTVSTFLKEDAVLFWDLGKGGLAKEQATLVSEVAKLVQTADPNRPVAADVWDGFRTYSRNVQLLGVHRWPLMTGLELSKYRDWLNQRRLLADPDAFMWTWVQTHLPDWYTNLVYERPSSQAFKEPIGPQAEQIRLLTYIALASGCKGLGFWSDRFLADSHQGRDRLLGMALLNQEIQMLEPLLTAGEAPVWIETSSPDVKAAVIRSKLGILVLPIWMGPGAQFVPGQAAAVNLSMTVPIVPRAMAAWQVSPGEVRSLKVERQVEGPKVTIPEFGLTSAVVFTSDTGMGGLVVRFQDQARNKARLAAQWSHTLADVELDKVTRVYDDLEEMGHGVPDGQALLGDARKRLQVCVTNWNNGDFREAYNESQRALRPLRILMRACWEQAVKELDAPVASPYAVSFFTLPQHWRFMDQVQRAGHGGNLLSTGGFEPSTNQRPDDWMLQEETLDAVDLKAQRVTENPHEGRQCLKLEIKAKTPVGSDGKPAPPPAALERTYLAIHSPAVRLQPGTKVQISGWIRIPSPPLATADGVLMYDNAGGEPLALRLTGELKKWRKFSLYRQVPASGTVNVTVALTGIGSAYFDDIRIEPLTGTAPTGTNSAQSLRQMDRQASK
ncbi:MAG: hypothetical protein ACJ8FY_00270 [Gemmataceae bacterium]